MLITYFESIGLEVQVVLKWKILIHCFVFYVKGDLLTSNDGDNIIMCLYYVKKSWNEQLPIKLKVLILIYACSKLLGALKSACKNDDS